MSSFVSPTTTYLANSPNVPSNSIIDRYKLWAKARTGVDPGLRPSLDLNFAANKSLVDEISGQNLVTFARATGPATYVDSDGLIKSASVNVPRFDHNPLTGESLGLLVEESRVNNLANSIDFSTNWTLSGISITRNNITSPANDNTGNLIIQDTSNSSHSVYYLEQYYANSVFLTHTIFVKKYSNTNRITFMYRDPFNVLGYTAAGVVFDFSTETFVKSLQWANSTFGQLHGYTVTKFPNGWYRISYTMKTGTDSNGGRVLFAIYPQDVTLSTTNSIGSISSIPSGTVGVSGSNYATNPGGVTFTGDGTSGVYIWGAQLEAGSFPTSYIPTSGSTATRSADDAFINGTNFSRWYNQNRGTFFNDVRILQSPPSNDKDYGFIITYQDDSIYRVFRHDYSGGGTSSTLQGYKISGGSLVVNIGVSTSATRRKTASALESFNFAFTANGLSPNQNTTENMNDFSPAVRLNFGGFANANGQNKIISRLTYWNRRLPNSNLQLLTQ